MGRFNTKEKPVTYRKTDTWTYQGDVAYSPISPESELVSLVATSFIVDKYYENEGAQLTRLQELTQDILEIDPEFIWKLAVFARNEWHMRSVSHVLAGEAIEHINGRGLTRQYLPRMVVRPDDATEIMAYWMSIHTWTDKDGITRKGGKNQMPRSLRKAMQEFFKNLSEYQARKYAPKLAKRQISLVDLLRMVHPDPKLRSDNGGLYKALIEESLAPADTWEVKVSAAGSDEARKIEAWNASIPEMGYMAKLRNLRNFEKFNIRSQAVVDHLTDVDAVRNSQQLPFRFMSAYNEISSDFYKYAIKSALLSSFGNLEVPSGRILIAIDSSGSMTSFMSMSRSKSPIEHAATLGSVLAYAGTQSKETEVEVVMFDDELQTIDIFDKGPIAIYGDIKERALGGSTYGHLVLQYALKRPKFDYIIYLTDMQFHNPLMWGSYWHTGNLSSREGLITKYRKLINPNMKLVFVDLQGYNRVLSPQDHKSGVYMISGYSEKIFEYIKIMDDPLALVKLIKQSS